MNTNDDKDEEEEEAAADIDLLAQARAALSLRRFAQAKSYATGAIESSNITQQQLVLANQILAVANVHIAAGAHLHNGIAHDWYAVLQLGTHDHNICTPGSLTFSYRTLANLLHPETNRLANAAEALNLVERAYSVLSDHDKKSVYDARFENASKLPPPTVQPQQRGPTFWCVCCTCFHVHQYERVHEGKELRCVICKNGFVAAELPDEPKVVEGTDMYFCVWGCFPVGFPSGYRFLDKEEKRVLEEKVPMAAAATPVPQTLKRPKQTARKTVRPVRFNVRLSRCDREGDVSGGGVDG